MLWIVVIVGLCIFIGGMGFMAYQMSLSTIDTSADDIRNMIFSSEALNETELRWHVPQSVIINGVTCIAEAISPIDKDITAFLYCSYDNHPCYLIYVNETTSKPMQFENSLTEVVVEL